MTNTTTALPKIDLDNFDPEAMAAAWTDYGTFELTGATIDAFRKTTAECDATVKKIFSLPAENLEAVDHQNNFHGFQNVLAQTWKKSVSPESQGGEIRSQVAFHFRPYPPFFGTKIPRDAEGNEIDLTPLYAYYEQSNAILKTLLTKIEQAFIHPSLWKDWSKRDRTVLMTRKYFPLLSGEISNEVQNDIAGFSTDAEKFLESAEKAIKADYASKKVSEDEYLKKKAKITEKGKVKGIPGHSDHGELTLVRSDQAGLEVLEKGTEQWIAAPKDAICINIGDWLYFKALHSAELDNSYAGNQNFTAGLHRVPEVAGERYSYIYAQNPDPMEQLKTPKGPTVRFEDFLRSDKEKYRNTERDKSAQEMTEAKARFVPANSQKIESEVPILYVTETAEQGQDSIVLVSGKNSALCSSDMNGAPETAYRSFSYAYSDSKERETTRLTTGFAEGARTFEVTLQHANDIFVVDESVVRAMPRGNDARLAIAKTIVPLNDYKPGSYEKPVYLIGRPLTDNEARDITHQKQQGLARSLAI